MQDSTEWRTEAELLRLVTNKVSESLNLDYKSSTALVGNSDRLGTELSKDVSAFANSDGGTIVFGIVEQGHLPDRLDEGVDPSERSREWLEELIHSNVRRRIDKLRIAQVPLDASSPGKVAYVVTVPASDAAPHMAKDHRYYKRHNFQSVPMEEYEVRDVSNRVRGPKLSLTLHLTARLESQLEFGVSVINESSFPAEYYIAALQLDERLGATILRAPFAIRTKFNLMIGYEGDPAEAILMQEFAANFAIPNHMPVWEGTSFSIAGVSIQNPDSLDGDYYIGWTIQTPRSASRVGMYKLTIDGGGIVLNPHPLR